MARASLVAAAAAAVLLFAGWSSAGVPRWTHWLCFPGAAHDWCAVQLPTVVVGPNDVPKFETIAVPANPPVDCFYVYPTVSQAASGNAPLKLQQPEKDAAIIQAAYFSKVCRVYAPLYRQLTDSYTHQGDPKLPYEDVLAAWRDYLAHDNHGRGVVLIGHSQGAGVLTQLIQQEIEKSPSERKLLVSAILLGGGVSVKNGSTAGGSFHHIPACTSASEAGCVIAYEAWNGTPPASWTGPSQSGQVYLCTNPGALGGGPGAITPIFPGLNSEGIVPPTSQYLRYTWVEFTGLYTARCVTKGNRSWLLVTRIQHPGDKRPTVQAIYTRPHELHPADVNIDLANLLSLVQSETAAWTAHH